jgi:hypothetical protein
LAIPVRVGPAMEDIGTSYIAQVEQSPEVQLAQESPPMTEFIPLSSVEKQANLDNTRLAPLWH